MFSFSTTLHAIWMLSLSISRIYAAASSTEDNGSFALWDIPDDQVKTSFNHPNATGAVSLPNNGGADGWSLSVQVAADVPIASGGMYGGDYGTFFTGIQSFLNAPVGKARNVRSDDDSLWETCTIFWDLTVAEYPAELREDDGSCSAGLSKDCISVIERQIVHDSSPQSGCTCPQLDKIDACRDSKLWKSTACAASLRRYDGPLHDQANNMTAYNETGSIAWPVAVVWFGDSPTDNSGVGGKTTAKLACVRANKAAEGAWSPESLRRQPMASPVVVWLARGV
ncbi:hypothetical protein PG996_006511 [Apiospora saccharicola]|uniref:Uncharacterized protein n=1 Tax=Apiospora saccharicola TaxID=335842 RepID=A0ABR1VPM7_9PEZI